MRRLPLHQQLAEILRAEIGTGHVAPGDRLPTEAELCERYGMSRPTVRQALAALTHAGLIRRRAGQGTFVAATVDPRRLIGVVVTRLKGLFSLDMLDGIRAAADSAGALVAIQCSNQRAGGEESAIQRLRAQGVAAVIVEPSPACDTPSTFWDGISASGFPVVFIDRYVPHVPIPRVVSDNFAGGYAVTAHLLQTGRRRLAFLVPPEYPTSSADGRLAGVRAAIRACASGAEDPWVVPVVGEGPDSLEGTSTAVARAAELMFSARDRTAPDGVICGHDGLAAELLAWCHERGVGVPQDLAVTGFDDLPFASLLQPALTTVRQDMEGMGRRAVALVLERLRGEGSPAEVVLPVDLCVRASTMGARIAPGGDAPRGTVTRLASRATRGQSRS